MQALPRNLLSQICSIESENWNSVKKKIRSNMKIFGIGTIEELPSMYPALL
jgi:hypothetical protein